MVAEPTQPAERDDRPESLAFVLQAALSEHIIGVPAGMLVAGLPMLLSEANIDGERLVHGLAGEIALCVLSAILALALVAWRARDLYRLSTWRRRVPFAVRGWDQLAAQPKLAAGYHWWLLELAFPEADPAGLERSFARFVKSIDTAYYIPSNREEDDRQRWSLSGRVAKGSADVTVTYKLIRWMTRELAPRPRLWGFAPSSCDCSARASSSPTRPIDGPGQPARPPGPWAPMLASSRASADLCISRPGPLHIRIERAPGDYSSGAAHWPLGQMLLP